MKLLLVICLAVASQAQSADDRINCIAPGATTATPNIPRGLCTAAGGTVEEIGDGTCCCFGAGAGDGDRCLPNVPRAVCLGVSVQGRCQAQDVERCCCRPAGVVSDLECVPRVPVPLCEKTTGAACVVAPTPVATCACRFGTGASAFTRELPVTVCDKFGGVCPTTSTTEPRCCCIYDGQTDLFGNPLNPSPTDPDVPARNECLPNTLVSACLEKRKRSGVCWIDTSITTAPAESPRCECQDPAVTGTVSALIDPTTGLPAQLLRHVCEDKLGSNCIVPTCCCKYPSAPNEPCLPDIQVPTCTAVGGAICVNQLRQTVAFSQGTAGELSEFAPSTCGIATGGNTAAQFVRTTGTGTDTGATTEFNPSTTLSNLGTNVPLFNLAIFGQQPTGDERVFTRFLSGTVTFDVSPASASFIVGAVNLKGRASQLGSTSEYIITVTPATAVPQVLSGFIGNNNVRASIINTGTGTYRLSFPSSTTVSGLLAFDSAVSSVTVTFPSISVTGVVDDSFTVAGLFPTFRGDIALPSPADINGGTTVTAATINGPAVAGSESDVIAEVNDRVATACENSYLSIADFATLPAPRLIQIGTNAVYRFTFPLVAEDSLLLHFTGITAGATIVVAQNDPNGLGFSVPRKLGGDATSGFGVAPAADDRSVVTAAGDGSFTVQLAGRPSSVIVDLSAGAIPTARIGFSLAGTAITTANAASVANDAYDTSFA